MTCLCLLHCHHLKQTHIQVIKLNYKKKWNQHKNNHEHNFAWIFVIKTFAIILPSQPLLGRHLGFHNFFMLSFFFAWATPFWQHGRFCVDKDCFLRRYTLYRNNWFYCLAFMHSCLLKSLIYQKKFWTSIETIIKIFQNILEFVSIDFWILNLLKSIIRCTCNRRASSFYLLVLLGIKNPLKRANVSESRNDAYVTFTKITAPHCWWMIFMT